MTYYVGIDPGVTGAMAVLTNDLRCATVVDMPTMQLGKNKQQVNAANLANIITDMDLQNLNVMVYVEEVAARPGQGVVSMFNFGVSYGVIQGICATLGLSMILIKPNLWKKMAGLIGKPKDAARTLAQQLYPDQDLSLKKHVGRADALLIARFGSLVGK